LFELNFKVLDRPCYNVSMSKRENFPSQRKYNTFSSNTTNKSNDSPSSLERATDILLCLGNGINSATEIADYCEYSISTVHRLLQSLTDLGWVVQDDVSHKYFIGALAYKLSSNLASAHRYLVLHALKEMSRLANLTQETIMLGGMDQFNFLRLHDIPSPHNLRIIEASDKMKGQYLGASAKVLLSQLEDKELKKLLKHIKNEPVTSSSIVDNGILMEQILQIRKDGYTVSYGERIKGAICIAAPITGYFCPLALSIIGPDDRLKPSVDNYIKELISSTRLISKEIAGTFDEQGGS
jgi:IclR family transcriptional regulator, KDG regulon repressor